MSESGSAELQGAAADASGLNAPDSANEAEALASEVRAVCTLLEEALSELYAPLSDLARASLRATEPPLRALVVLATAVLPSEAPALRERRILLAAALEMLAVALRIHNLLLSAATAHGTRNGTATRTTEIAAPELDRSLAGSTILTGDYCFSRAAVLAAQTNSPTVVDIFSQALKKVSEGRLRAFFDPAGEPFVENTELMHAGVRGAVHLAALSPAHMDSALALADALASSAQMPETTAENAGTNGRQRARWQAAWGIVADQDGALPAAN